MRECIHGRTERQQCALCNLRSKCCGNAVYKIEDKYVCETCDKECEVIKEKEWLQQQN